MTKEDKPPLARSISAKLDKKYETPSQLDIHVGVTLLYVNLLRFEADEVNENGEEPVRAHVQIDRIEADVVHMSVLHDGPLKTLEVPIMAICTVTPSLAHKNSRGEEIRFFINKYNK